MTLLDALPDQTGLRRIWAVLPQARLVGGCVRDLLAGIDVNDLDLATPEPPEVVSAKLTSDGIKVVPTGLSHGTVTAVIERRPYEITTLRRDESTDGRHAVVSWTDDWGEDAARRDFTINAMSLDSAGRVHDFFGGQDDLRARRVRFVGDAARRIHEDALRIFRFFRFDARFGGATPNDAALHAIRCAVELVDGLSIERTTSELLRILAGPRAFRALSLMLETGVLARRLPVGDLTLDRFRRLLDCSSPDDGLLRLGALCDAAHLPRDMRLSTAQEARLAAMHKTATLTPLADNDDLRRARAVSTREALIDRSWLVQAEQRGAPDTAWDGLRVRLNAMPQPIFPIAGRDALKEGIPPGPKVGEALRAVEAWWLSEGCRPDRVSCLARLHSALRA